MVYVIQVCLQLASRIRMELYGQFFCPSSGVFHCTHSNGICHTGLLTASEQDQHGTPWSCSQAVSKPVWHIPLLCVQWKTPDVGQRNCPKHVEFHSKNKFEKLVYLVGFIITNSSRCTVTWTSNIIDYCVISGFRRNLDEICALLGHYAAQISNSVMTILLRILDPWRWNRYFVSECR